MEPAILFVKSGCPYCAAAIEYLDQHKVNYQKTDVLGNDAAMAELERVSGQRKTPTLVRNGEVLSDFGIPELERFLKTE